MGKTPEEMAASMIANLAEKTGKDLAGWLEASRELQCNGLSQGSSEPAAK